MKQPIKRILCLAMACLLTLSLASCLDTDKPSDTDTNPDQNIDSNDTPNPKPSTGGTGTSKPSTDGTGTSQPSTDGTGTSQPSTDENDNKTPTTPPKSLKILAIGNSFSVDSMQYLYGILEDGGVENIVLGNLYYPGCNLNQHLSYAKADSASYEQYYKNTTGTWTKTPNTKMSTALLDEDWDYISLQESSKTSGLSTYYGDTLTQLIDYVRGKCPRATLIWNMTWAYQQDSTHKSFPSYDNDQAKMYQMIINCVEQYIETRDCFDIIIPCGTSIQNARTSFLGDNLTRDGYHMDLQIGRYITALTWYAAITGCDVSNITYNSFPEQITAAMLEVAKESVTNAIKTPKAVTKSKITDATLAAKKGIDLSLYTLLEWDHLNNTYWVCTNSANTTTPAETGSTYQQNVCSKKKYSLSDLPVGTVFICPNGNWQFRLEIYKDSNKAYNGTRPGMIKDEIYVLNSALVGDCKYIAWNVSTVGKDNISKMYERASRELRIYIPKT